MIHGRATDHPAEIRARQRAIIGCAVTGSLGILLLDALILRSGVGYDLEDNVILYSVAVHNVMARSSVETWFRLSNILLTGGQQRLFAALARSIAAMCSRGDDPVGSGLRTSVRASASKGRMVGPRYS